MTLCSCGTEVAQQKRQRNSGGGEEVHSYESTVDVNCFFWNILLVECRSGSSREVYILRRCRLSRVFQTALVAALPAFGQLRGCKRVVRV